MGDNGPVPLLPGAPDIPDAWLTRLQTCLRLNGSDVVLPTPELWSWLVASERVRGFTRGREAVELFCLARELPASATIVEIGSFLGSSTILLAGALRCGRGGMCHCFDPFDDSGDAFSRSYYAPHLTDGSLLSEFGHNISAVGLDDFVTVHVGRAEDLGLTWNTPIDMLYMDGDQSPAGARAAWDLFSPRLAPHAIVALHNAELTNHRPDHDGQRILAEHELMPPRFGERRWIGTTCFASRQ